MEINQRRFSKGQETSSKEHLREERRFLNISQHNKHLDHVSSQVDFIQYSSSFGINFNYSITRYKEIIYLTK